MAAFASPAFQVSSLLSRWHSVSSSLNRPATPVAPARSLDAIPPSSPAVSSLALGFPTPPFGRNDDAVRAEQPAAAAAAAAPAVKYRMRGEAEEIRKIPVLFSF
ncbi:hypothetical protein HDU96_007601 [Phlyctochytrium bullatum]|nr:hypothetical protein HDU96_007601 [Phlyctochytrium bullatum]